MSYITDEELQKQIEENKKIYTEHYDEEFVVNIIEQVLSIIDETYFRSRYIGFRNLPERNNPERPLIYASNHSGMAFPWDAIIFGCGLLKKHKFDWTKTVRPLAAPMLSQSTLMNPFLMRNAWKKTGCVDATTLNFETMMQQSESNLLIYPEGVPGIGKGFNKRYQLQRFSTSFLRMSIKYKTDVIPYATINGEYINPYVYSIPWLNKLANKVGIPFVPFGIIFFLLLLQPWIFYAAWPAKLIFVMGERIKPYDMINKSYEEMTREDYIALRDKIHTEMQEQFDKAVAVWGQEPFQIKEFWQRFWQNIKRFPYNMPFGWPLLFAEFERKWYRSTERPLKLKLGFLSTLRILIMNPITIFYFVPVIGWIPILIKGYWPSKDKKKG